MKIQNRKNKSDKKIHGDDGSGLFIPAFLLLGLGISMIFGRPDVGALAGLGVGFLAMALSKLIQKKSR